MGLKKGTGYVPKKYTPKIKPSYGGKYKKKINPLPLSAVTGSQLYEQPYAPKKPEGVHIEDWLEKLHPTAPVVKPPKPSIWEKLRSMPEWDFQDALKWLSAPKAVDLYTPAEEAQKKYPALSGKGQSPALHTIAEVGDTYLSLAEKYGADPTELMDLNDSSVVHAGDSVNLPQFGGLTKEEQYWQDKLNVPANYIDFLTHQETLNVSGTNRFGGRTSAPTESGIVYPEGWNTEEFRMFAENTKDTSFWNEYRNLDMSTPATGEYAPAELRAEQAFDPSFKAEQFYPDRMIETGGIPSYHKWEQDASGQWKELPPEAVFDALYEMKGIDPNDPDMVERFWGFADDDLLYMGEFFDVLDYPTGGYGGYGGTAPSYGNGYSGSGQRPQRSDYSSYLGLTSWSI